MQPTNQPTNQPMLADLGDNFKKAWGCLSSKQQNFIFLVWIIFLSSILGALFFLSSILVDISEYISESSQGVTFDGFCHIATTPEKIPCLLMARVVESQIFIVGLRKSEPHWGSVSALFSQAPVYLAPIRPEGLKETFYTVNELGDIVADSLQPGKTR